MKVSDEDILSAAREVFLSRGLRATTADVALRAGISEGTIFNRFKSKGDLFHAAMELELADPTWLVELCANVNRGELDANLVALGLRGLDYFTVAIPMNMMAWSNRGAESKSPLLRIVKRLASYFEAEMRCGRMRRHDPEIVARTFAGGLVSYAYMESVENNSEELPMPREMFVRGLVNVLCCGVSK